MVRGGKILDKIIEQISNDDEKITKVRVRGISDDGAIRLANGE